LGVCEAGILIDQNCLGQTYFAVAQPASHFGGCGGFFEASRASLGEVFRIARVVKNLRTVFVEEDNTMNIKRSLWSVASLIAAAIVLLHLAFPSTVRGQASLTTGAIAGIVTDPTGAVVPHATVTATNSGTNASRSATTGANGGYVVPLLDPGEYKVSVKASGFRTSELGPLTVTVSQTVDLNFKLELGTATQVVEVTGAAPLLQTTNPNTTSTLGTQQIEAIPNPGMDLSYEANFAPGAVMNTTGGYGNVEYNGLPSVSNNFTIDGLDANDPFLNLNNSGATNLQLGLSAMQEVSVNTTSYSVDQGRLGASQVNFLSKSGTNSTHGKLWETWNGSKLNAADYFINARQFVKANPAALGNPPQKPRSNVNQFGGDIGGRIIPDKLFYYGDLEEIRVIVPIVQSNITYPSKNYANYVLQQLAVGGGCDYAFDPGSCAAGQPVFGFIPNTPPEPGEIPFYQNMFNLYGNPAGAAVPSFGCPLNPDGSLLPIPSPATPNASIPNGTGCAIQRTFSQAPLTNDQFILVKVDQNVNERNAIWYKFVREHGLQATYTDPINPLFTAISDQPQYNGEVGWTHTFGPTLVNEFTPGVVWYSAIFKPADNAKTNAAMPINYFGPFAGMGGIDLVWPQGRNVTQVQLIDNLTWSHGTHTFKFGGNLRRLLVSDHDYGFFNTPEVVGCTLPEFTYGVSCFTQQAFPKSLDEPFGINNLDLFAQDTYRFNSKITLTYGLRGTWNSDPVNQQNLNARFAGSFYQISHNVDRPLNQDIQTGLSKLLPSTPLIEWQPRVALAYEITPKTVFRGGFGVFSDIFPASLADNISQNPPYYNTFNEGYFGLGNGIGIAPGVAGSAIDAAANDNQTFLAGFSSGALSCQSALAGANCLPQLNIAATEHFMPYPLFYQWSGGIQHQFTGNLMLNIQYVGTHSSHIPYTMGANGVQTVCDGCYKPWSFNSPLDQRFFNVTQYTSGANSIYHGLQATVNKRFSHGLNFQFNYAWGRCLDTISNGGFFGYGGPNNVLNAIPGDLRRNYGPCDYDFRHTFNGYYTYELPFHARNRVLSQVIGGWQLSGSVIFHSGQPFSMGTPLQGGAIVNGSGPGSANGFANLISGQPLYNKHTIAQIGAPSTDCVAAEINGTTPCITTPGNNQWLNPNAFLAVVDPDTSMCVPQSSNVANAVAGEGISPALCQFGDMQRNFLRGPSFGWSDLFLTKRIKLTERVAFIVSGQAYNFLNHPNFANPGGLSAGVPLPGTDTLNGFGQITHTAYPPTGLLGSFLGGDTSVRMIAFKGQLQF
jgi:carboxypeptidase family protein